VTSQNIDLSSWDTVYSTYWWPRKILHNPSGAEVNNTCKEVGSRDSSIGRATGYRLEGRVSILNRFKILLFAIGSRPTLDPTQPPIQWVPVSFSPGVKRTGREADNSLLSSPEVKNSGAILPLPHTSSWSSAYLIKYRDKFVFLPFTYHIIIKHAG
jgi:hypothetical protein